MGYGLVSGYPRGYPCHCLLVDEVRDKRQRVFVLDCDRVEVTVVLNWVKRAVLLLYEEERGCERGL